MLVSTKLGKAQQCEMHYSLSCHMHVFHQGNACFVLSSFLFEVLFGVYIRQNNFPPTVTTLTSKCCSAGCQQLIISQQASARCCSNYVSMPASSTLYTVYTSTQVHKYTSTQVHKYTSTPAICTVHKYRLQGGIKATTELAVTQAGKPMTAAKKSRGLISVDTHWICFQSDCLFQAAC